jgi:transcriptional regulator with XRE-family HTH domain
MHTLFADDPVSDDDAASELEDHVALGSEARAALGVVGLEAMSPEARALIIKLTDYSESLEPTARESFVSAAERGLQWRRNNSSALPVLLFTRRREQDLKPDQIAASLGLTPEAVAKLESGGVSLRSTTAEVIARWIDYLHVTTTEAETALKLSVGHAQPSTRAAGRRPRSEPDVDDAFVDEVLGHLRRLQEM